MSTVLQPNKQYEKIFAVQCRTSSSQRLPKLVDIPHLSISSEL